MTRQVFELFLQSCNLEKQTPEERKERIIDSVHATEPNHEKIDKILEHLVEESSIAALVYGYQNGEVFPHDLDQLRGESEVVMYP